MAKLKCECGNTYFKKVIVNEFHNYSGNIYGSLPEVDIDSNLVLYECINNQCRKILTPTLSYNSPQPDRDLTAKVEKIIEGDTSVIKDTAPKGRAPRPGEVTRQELTRSDPSQLGKFVRV